nr:ribonuclease H-like domain-containing protein [Tanacetum cinerariifolium]
MHKAFPLPGIEFPLAKEVPTASEEDTTSGETGKKSGRTVTLTAEDMQKKKNDVKARTTLLLCLPDEHQLRFKWLMHTIVWRNRSDLDTMSLDDLYNHLKVYESEVQKKSEPNSQNMAFISSAKHSSRNEDCNTACVPTASTNVPTASTSVATISQDTACAYIASQSSDRVGWDWSYMANDEEDHALVADEVAPIEFTLMANTNAERLAQVESRLVEYKEREVKYCEKIRTLEFTTESNNECIKILKKKLETLKQEKEGVDGKLAGLLTASKDLDGLIESQIADMNKEGLGYSAVPPPPAQIYSSPKKDLSWTGLLEFADDTVTDYSRPSPTIESPDLVLKKKACFNYGDFNHLGYDCRKRVKKSFTPKPVAHTPYRPPVRPVRTNMNGARPNRTSFNKQAHSYANKPFHRTSAVRSNYRTPWVPTVNRIFPPVNRKFSTGSRNFPTANRKFPTASRKFPAGSTKCSTPDMGMKGKAGSSQNNINDKGYWDSGCSRHMTGNISYLSDYEPFDGGYMSFGQGGCNITGKGTIKTGKLEFENMYFVKDL